MYVQVVKNTAYLLISQLPPIICKLGPPRKEQKRCFQPFFKVCLRKLCVQVRTSFISIYILEPCQNNGLFLRVPKRYLFWIPKSNTYFERGFKGKIIWGFFHHTGSLCLNKSNLGLLSNTFTNLRNFE